MAAQNEASIWVFSAPIAARNTPLHAQQMHSPGEFADEVQRHIAARQGRVQGDAPTNWADIAAKEGNELPEDPATAGQAALDQSEMAQKEAIQNVADEGNPPVIPAPGSKTVPKNPMTDAQVPPTSAKGTGIGSVQVAGGTATAQESPKKSKLPSKTPRWEDLP